MTILLRSRGRRAASLAPWTRTLTVDCLVALIVVAALSLLIGVVEPLVHVPNISNLYIIGTAFLAARRGLFSAVLASVLAFLSYDWFFISPVHRFTVDDPSEYIVLVTLLVTSVLIGQLLARVQNRALEAQRQQARTQLLYEVGQAALSSSDVGDVYALALRRLGEAVGLAGSLLFIRGASGLEQVAAHGAVPESPDRGVLIQRVVEETRPVGIWYQPGDNVRIASDLGSGVDAPCSFEGGILDEVGVPLSIESRVEGVLVAVGKSSGESLTTDEVRFLRAFANQLAGAIQRDRLADQKARARALEESDRLKSALISSVSHELKTPLTAIKASATTLLEEGMELDQSIRRELAGSINRETDRLTRLVSNLLDMSRLESGALRLRAEWVSIDDVIADVLDRMEPVVQGRSVAIHVPDSLPEVPLDFVLISQVLTNLLDNAVRYSPAGAPISISAEVVQNELRVSVFNEGSQIPPSDLNRLFDKFYRLSTEPGGTGLGLAIARGIVEAHHGRIWAENVGRQGVAFRFTLPSFHHAEVSAAPASSSGLQP